MIVDTLFIFTHTPNLTLRSYDKNVRYHQEYICFNHSLDRHYCM